MIAELVAMAREVSADANRGQQFSPALTSDELALYDVVAQNESAVTEMGPGAFADIARDLVKSLRRDVTTDWVSRDDVRVKLRSIIKRLLARYSYPPDAQPGATELVLRQMEPSPRSGRQKPGGSFGSARTCWPRGDATRPPGEAWDEVLVAFLPASRPGQDGHRQQRLAIR